MTTVYYVSENSETYLLLLTTRHSLLETPSLHWSFREVLWKLNRGQSDRTKNFHKLMVMRSTEMDDIEKECEDAVFEVCDARERYPAMCANELARCIKLENEICVAPVKSNSLAKLDAPLITKQQISFLENLGIGSKKDIASIDQRNKKMANILKKMEDLKIAAEQIEREKYADINRLLRK